MKTRNYNSETIILDNSPIQFVLVGPRDGIDTILVRSRNAELDLIGLSSFKSFFESSADERSLINNIFSKNAKQLNVVNSELAFDAILDFEFNWRSDSNMENDERWREDNRYADDRRSRFRFGWTGLASRLDRRRIEAKFNELINALIFEIAKNNIIELEMLIGTLIYECSLIHNKRSTSRRISRTILAFYVLLLIITLIFLLQTMNSQLSEPKISIFPKEILK